MNKQLLIVGGVATVVGAGVGFGAGYLVFKKRFEAISAAEIASVREAYARNGAPKPNLVDLVRDRPIVAVQEPVVDQEGVISAAGYDGAADETDADAFRRAHGRVPSTYELIQMGNGVEAGDAARSTPDHDDVNFPEGNIFDNPMPDADADDIGDGEFAEDPRSPERPYVITAAEWFMNETNFDQIVLTYWADDDVLADDAKRMITEVQDVVGATNLHRFGFKSEDPDKVYVRNERLKADYEIIKDERNFSEVVHGIDPELVNNSGVPRRMRSNDE